ncbi:ATP binding [Tritrichomonas musculus]|uniref:ATP binding n=1 Tax=Tritrichomonas musculus TaxID=1915356 RepID=A0ABR2KIY0_9EUKA
MKNTIVFEIGSSTCKVGFAGKKNPEIIFPNVVAFPKFHENQLNVLVGNETVDNRMMVHYYPEFPVEKGKLTIHEFKGKNLLNYVIDYAYECLKEDPSQHPVLILDSPMNGSDQCLKNRMDLSKIFFEDYNVPYLYFGNQNSLALLYAGLDTGVVLDCGHSATSCITIYEGYPIERNAIRLEYAGKDITEFLQKKVGYESGIDDFVIRKRFSLFDDFKKRNCYVSLAFDQEINDDNYAKGKSIIYEGHVLQVEKEQFECAEILFNPGLGLVKKGISEIIFDIINGSYSGIQSQLAENVFITGGTAQMTNFIQRIQNDLDNMSTHLKFHVKMIPDPELAAWRGASKFGMISNFNQIAVSKKEYNLKGCEVIYKKCF